MRSRVLREADTEFRGAQLRLFRSYLHCYVTSASPLLVDLIDHFDLDLDPILRGLRPQRGWPLRDGSRKGAGRYWPGHVGPEEPIGRWLPPRRAATHPRAKASGGSPEFQVMLHGTALDVQVRIGGVLMGTANGELCVWLASRLPETVAESARGRNLTEVVDHPLLRNRGYRIDAVVQAGDHTLLVVGATRVPFEMPDLNV